MINNLSYLKQTKDFKTFVINNKRCNQMFESKYSFYKYSQADVLDVDINELCSFKYETNYTITKFISNIQSQWEQVGRIDKNHDNWLTNLFKSIKSLKLHDHATMVLLNKLPLDVLFDPRSQFESLIINHYWDCRT